ncbi:MAG: hypothetical protein HUJ71_08380 [Pseudobutyrivibrio sp.]|nr:hypothetical protein [Pseudobutyrivibrio sp.]
MVVQEYHRNAFWDLLSDGSMAKETALLHRQQQLKSQANNLSLSTSDRLSIQNELDDIKVEIRSFYIAKNEEDTSTDTVSEEEAVASMANISKEASSSFNSQANMQNADVYALLFS